LVAVSTVAQLATRNDEGRQVGQSEQDGLAHHGTGVAWDQFALCTQMHVLHAVCAAHDDVYTTRTF
jgi:hypothetical protein